MILQALYEYYQRKASDPESGIAPEGFKWIGISFVVVIDLNGKFVAIENTTEGQGRTQLAKIFLLPKPIQRTGALSYSIVNFLWDHVGYVFQHPKSETEKDLELAKNQHKTWIEALKKIDPALAGISEISALQKFYANDNMIQLKTHPLWIDCVKKDGTNIIFRIDGALDPIPCSEAVRQFVESRQKKSTQISEDESDEDTPHSMRCLVTGEFGEIARIHTKTPINKDCKSLVGIQKDKGYDSYGKTQAFNSPISHKAESAYTTALTHLLEKGSKNKVLIGDTTAIYWSAKKTELEDNFFSLWNTDTDNPDRNIKTVETLLKSPYTGFSESEGDTPFYILGLAPGGGSRISVRFWHTGTVRKFSNRIGQHFHDLQIVLPKIDSGNCALFGMLKDISNQKDVNNIPPILAGNLVQAILTGGVYPATLLQQTVRRIRSEQQRKKPYDENVTRIRASILKAYLNRKIRFQKHNQEEEITVALDLTNINSGYRLGRLFAALEKIQEDAHPTLNATIRDRFYGSASSSPITVFPQLLKLKNHHLSKISNVGTRVNHEKRLGEIFSGLNPDMPSHLAMEDQARFAIGYYHQRQAFFNKPE